MVDADEPTPPRRRKRAARALEHAPAAVGILAEIGKAIEYERTQLSQIHAMLRCLYGVLLYADDDDSVMHADVASVAARLLNESVTRLEALCLSALRLDDAAVDKSDDSDETHRHQVKDTSPAYWSVVVNSTTGRLPIGTGGTLSADSRLQ
jgi:hypothetical protein